MTRLDKKKIMTSRGFSTTKTEVKAKMGLERTRESLQYYDDLYSSKLVGLVVSLAREFSKEVLLDNCLYSQTIRALSSISSNVLEGFSRGSEVDNLRFLRYALGSAYEAKNHLNVNPALEEGKFDSQMDVIIELTEEHVYHSLESCDIYEDELVHRAITEQSIKLDQ